MADLKMVERSTIYKSSGLGNCSKKLSDKENGMVFQYGKTYKSNSGKVISIVGVADTKMFGKCLVAEEEYGQLSPVGQETEYTVNWHEVTPSCPASDPAEDVARSLSGLDATALNKVADALRGMNDKAKAYVAGKNTADELYDKCQTCVNKVKYQDDVPCCDCDPAGKASGYEGSDSKRRKLYVVMVRKCDNDACVRTYMITGDNNSSEDEVYNRAISNKDLFEYITVHEVDTTSDDYRIIVEDKSTGEEK